MGTKEAEESLEENWKLYSPTVQVRYPKYPAVSFSERLVLLKSFVGEVDCEIFETGCKLKSLTSQQMSFLVNGQAFTLSLWPHN